jgi:carboxymethylenebutenolidase
MDLQTEWITFPSADAIVPAYTSRPRAAREPLPAIIVIQEIWGVDDHIQDLVHRYATAGYFAAAPDLYAHGGQRAEVFAPERVATVKRTYDMTPGAGSRDAAAREAAFAWLPARERAAAVETAGAVFAPDRPVPRYAADIAALAVFLRGSAGCNGRVGSVGYCFGGLLSALLAGGDPELRAAAIYYGHSPDPAAVRTARCPIVGFYGAEDVRVTSGVPALEQTLREAGVPFEAHVYPGAPHAFFNDTRPSYRVDAARDAWARTLAFFARELGGVAGES